MDLDSRVRSISYFRGARDKTTLRVVSSDMAQRTINIELSIITTLSPRN